MILLLLASLAQTPTCDDTLITWLHQTRLDRDKQFEYAEPTSQERAHMRLLFNKFITAPEHELTQKLAANAGMKLGTKTICEQQFWLLSPITRKSYAHGIYLHNTDSSSTHALSVPHQFHDLATGEIGTRMASTGEIRLLALNSVHRYTPATTKEIKADAAHNSRSIYHAFFGVASEKLPALSVVELHGYNQQKRKQHASRK